MYRSMTWPEGLDCLPRSSIHRLGIIEIRVAEVTGDDGVSEVAVQLGNKVLIAVCPPDPASIEYEIRFLRGKRSSERVTGH